MFEPVQVKSVRKKRWVSKIF